MMRREGIAALGVFFYILTGLTLFFEAIYSGDGLTIRILIMWIISAASFTFVIATPRSEP